MLIVDILAIGSNAVACFIGRIIVMVVVFVIVCVVGHVFIVGIVVVLVFVRVLVLVPFLKRGNAIVV